MGRQGAGAGRSIFLARQRSRYGQRRDNQPIAGDEHRYPKSRVVEGRIGVQPRKGAAVIVSRGGEGIKGLRKDVCSRVAEAIFLFTGFRVRVLEFRSLYRDV